MQDIISSLCSGVVEFIAKAPWGFVTGVARESFMLAGACTLSGLSHLQGNLNAPIKIAWAICGGLIGILVPVSAIGAWEGMARVWVLVTCMLILWYFPKLLAYLVCEPDGPQRRLAKTIYVVVIVLTLVQVFAGGAQ